MPNNTFDDYKIAVKNKYEEVRNSEYFVYLDNPTRGRLRNLCWELFLQQNRNQDDLNVFSSLLGLSFDVTKKNKFDDQKINSDLLKLSLKEKLTLQMLRQ